MDQNRIRRERRKERGGGTEDLRQDGKSHYKKRPLLPGEQRFEDIPQRSFSQRQREEAMEREMRAKKERKERRAREVEERMWESHRRHQLRAEQLERDEQQRIARLEEQAGLRKLYKPA
eukprot:CAMPEP_0174276778 /NCGR_PEP_ID=MMETSP0439-20130205/60575_1 /TAXON_ID=0 /ORGANISM="Stereomyxa ramosa, Strain Chinc5" /LENGTH=118 /DNA_ID=CAMNT_0015369045 /DNA_START=998 /DNA_END=1351 /DNA_ORIENTATION=+